jgi:hypothetical protein
VEWHLSQLPQQLGGLELAEQLCLLSQQLGQLTQLTNCAQGGEATPVQVLQPDACLQRTQQHWAEEPLHKKQASGTHLSIPEQQPHH